MFHPETLTSSPLKDNQNCLPWVALQTKPNHERVAALNLEARGLEIYLPVYKSQRRWSDRNRTMELPLFPSYVFCRYDQALRVKILSSIGVSRIVSFAGEPAMLQEDEMDAVRRIVESGLECGPETHLSAGSPVRVTGGPLMGLEGIVTSVRNSRGWVVVSLPMLQRAVGVAIDRGLLEPMPAKPIRIQ